MSYDNEVYTISYQRTLCVTIITTEDKLEWMSNDLHGYKSK